MTARLDAPWLRQGPLADLLSVLDRDGEQARVVGGAVRNALLGQMDGDAAPGDFDIATTAVPDEVTRRAVAAGFRVLPTGIAHGTVTVLVRGRPFEVTTLRRDVETDGRHAVVAFGRDWRADAERRDFTMNALSLGRDGTVHDPVGGLADLNARRVRFIGDPHARIVEDVLRVLRFFRFHAIYGEGAPDAEGLAASIAARDALARLSRERVRAEMVKLLVAPRAAEVLGVMSDAGLLQRILGGVAWLGAFSRMTMLEALLRQQPDAARRLGVLAAIVPDDAARLAARLRLSRDERTRIAAMADGWWHVGPGLTEPAARAMLYRLGKDIYRDRVLMAWAHAAAAADDAAWARLADLPLRWSPPPLPFSAADFMARGIEKGPSLGKAMRCAETAWIAADFPAAVDIIAALIDTVAAASSPAGARAGR